MSWSTLSETFEGVFLTILYNTGDEITNVRSFRILGFHARVRSIQRT